MELASVIAALGGEKAFGGPVRSPMDLEARVRDGLPKKTLTALAEHFADRADARLKVIYGDVPRATWTRRKDKLSPTESELVERLGRLWAQAIRVWENEPDTRAFMAAPHAMLAGRTPIDAARTELGGRQVERILNGLEYGLPV